MMSLALQLFKQNADRDLFGFPTLRDPFFEEFFGESGLSARNLNKNFTPAVDVKETENHYVLSLDVPGISKKDIHLELDADRLVIFGERKNEKEEKKDKFHLVEKSYGTFRREFSLPKGVDTSNIEAIHKDGVLQVAIPKGKEIDKKTIPINDAKEGGFFKTLLGNQKDKVTE